MSGQFTLLRKMILGGIVAVVVPSLVTGFIITLWLTDSLQDIFGERATLTAKNMASIIDVTLEKELDFASAVAVDNSLVELVAEKKYALAMNRLKTAYKKVKSDYLAVLIADTDGIVRADLENDAANIDISDRHYFMKARSGAFAIEGPFVGRLKGDPMVAISCPIHKGKEFVGALIVALEMDYLVDMISSIKIGKTDYAFITDKHGLVIVHPEKNLVFRANLFREPGMESISGRMSNGETGWEAYAFRGKKKIAGFTHLGVTGWNIAFAQDRDEIMAPVDAMIGFLLISGSLFIVLVIVILTVLSSKISSPAQKSIDLLQELIEHSESAILTMRPDHRITDANPAAEAMLGRRKEQLIGTEPVLENADNTPAQTIWNELKYGRVWSGNVVVKASAPEPLTFAVMIIPVTNVSGEVESYLEIARDITEEQKFRSRVVQTQKMEALGTLAGGIAHDFNNILSAIFAYTEMSLMVPGNPPETDSNLRKLMTASERARDLVSQILTFSRKSGQELRPLTPKLIVKEAIKLLRASIPAQIELRATVVSDAMIMAEPIQIHQIVVNICTNAVHAIGSKPGTIDVSLDDMFVDEEFARSHPGLQAGNHILLKITDSGKGIEREIVDRIFEPFFTTKPLGEGTGLGLSVVHGIVQKLNGIITVYSTVGKGTVFNIIIPALGTETTESGRRVAAITGGTERILLVDDEKAIIEPLANILTNLGYHVSAFTDSLQALDAFTRSPDAFDVVITDYSMPYLSGVEIVNNIRKIRSDIPVIVNSGYITKEITELLTKIGVRSILTKPVNTYQVADAIRKAFI